MKTTRKRYTDEFKAGIRRGKTTITTVSNPKAPCPLDKVNREFRVSRPNALWVVDSTYVHTWAGFVYVTKPSGYPMLDRLLRRLHHQRSSLLRVLERPEIPLHTKGPSGNNCSSLDPSFDEMRRLGRAS